MTREARSIRCPEGVLGWIPWYGEDGEDGLGVLTERQRGAVEAHCAECADCRVELDMISGAPYEIDIELPDPDRVFQEITARIDAGEAGPADVEASTPVIPIGRGRRLEDGDYGKLAAWILDEETEAELLEGTLDAEETPEDESAPNVVRGNFGGLNSGRAGWAAAAAILLLGLGGLGGAFFTQSGSGAYELATQTPVSLMTAPARSPQIDVIFVSTASVAQISDTLHELGVEIVSGPTMDGRYRLARRSTLPASPSTDGSSAAKTAEQLRSAPVPIVLFAEPVP